MMEPEVPQSKDYVVGYRKPPLHSRFVPGISGNPGGLVPGKRVSTWMAEYGDKPVSEWPQPNTPEYDKLPGNAQIALARLRCARKENQLGLGNAQYIEPRQSEQKGMTLNFFSPESYDALAEAYFKAKSRAQCSEQENG